MGVEPPTVSVARGAFTLTQAAVEPGGILAFDGSNNLYVANWDAGTVSKFALGATTPMTAGLGS